MNGTESIRLADNREPGDRASTSQLESDNKNYLSPLGSTAMDDNSRVIR